jgi:hypothetical protein
MLHLSDFELKEGTKEKLRRYALRVARTAVSASSARDALLSQDVDLFYDRLPQFTSAGWEGASTLRSNILQSAVSKTRAQMLAALRSTPLVEVQSLNKEKEESARRQTKFLRQMEEKIGLTEALERCVLNVLLYPYAVVGWGWRTQRRLVRKEFVRGGRVQPEDFEPDELIPLSVWLQHFPMPEDPQALTTFYEEEWESGPYVESLHPLDFYPYPANATKLEMCLATVERVRLLPEDLKQGVTERGYDAESVRTLLDRMVSMPSTQNVERQMAEGDLGLEGDLLWEDRVVEGYWVYFRVPAALYTEVPETLLHETLCALVFPEQNTCVLLDVNPYEMYISHPDNALSLSFEQAPQNIVRHSKAE